MVPFNAFHYTPYASTRGRLTLPLEVDEEASARLPAKVGLCNSPLLGDLDLRSGIELSGSNLATLLRLSSPAVFGACVGLLSYSAMRCFTNLLSSLSTNFPPNLAQGALQALANRGLGRWSSRISISIWAFQSILL